VSEIEFCTLYVVAERWILGCILRFMHGENDFSDTLISIHWGVSDRSARDKERWGRLPLLDDWAESSQRQTAVVKREVNIPSVPRRV
jgi:hypothetical protein